MVEADHALRALARHHTHQPVTAPLLAAALLLRNRPALRVGPVVPYCNVRRQPPAGALGAVALPPLRTHAVHHLIRAPLQRLAAFILSRRGLPPVSVGQPGGRLVAFEDHVLQHGLVKVRRVIPELALDHPLFKVARDPGL